MGNNITPNHLRGFLIPSITLKHDSIWDAQSTYNQKNSRAGIPEAQQIQTSMALQTIGTQEERITIETIQGGTPGETAGYYWEDQNGNTYGRDWKSFVSQWDYWDFQSSPAVGTYTHMDAIETVPGILFVVSEIIDSSGRYTISLQNKEREGAVTNVHTFFSEILLSTPNSQGHPAILQLSDDALYVCRINYTSSDSTNITAYRSYDNGDTWQTITTRALFEDIDIGTSGYDIKDMRLATQGNIILLFLELVSNTGVHKNRVAQYRSMDDGLTFYLVGEVSQGSEGSFHNIRPVSLPNNTVGCAYITDIHTIKFRRIPNPNIRLSSSYWQSQEITIQTGATLEWATVSGGELTEGNLAIWYQDSRIFVIAEQYNDGRFYGWYSSDNGDTWNPIGNGSFFRFGDWNNRLNHIVVSTFESRAVILGNHKNSAHMLYLGGYTTAGAPPLFDNPPEDGYANWQTNYIPFVTPDTSSLWTTAGAGSHTVGINGLDIQTSVNSRYYTYTGSSGIYFTQGQLFRFRLEVPSSVNRTLDYIAFKATQDSGTASKMLNIRFNNTGFDIRDNSSILQSVSHPMTNQTEFLIGWLGSTAKIHYRTKNDKPKDWNIVTVTIPSYATGAGNTVLWGHISPSTSQSKWQEFYVSSGSSAGLSNKMNPVPAPYPLAGEYAYIAQGLRITTSSSPARGEDQYIIDPKYDFPIKNIFHNISLSPRIPWRSKDITAQTIGLYIDPNVQANEKNHWINDVYGLHLANVNFKEGILKRWNGTSWDTVYSFDLSNGLTGSFERSGSSIQSSSTGEPFYLNFNEAVGWRAILKSGENEHVVKIIRNSEGAWGKNTDKKRCVLVFDAEETDYSTLPSSGTIELIPSQATLIIDALGDSNLGDSALRLELPTQPLLEDYFQIGTMIIGPVVFIAPQYQRGRTISFEPNIIDYETRDGMFFARKMSNGRRTASIAWTEPIDTTRVMEKNPDYWQLSQTTGAQPIANYGDAPFTMMGLYQAVYNAEPLVYLPSVKKGLDAQILNRYHDHILARTTGQVSIESVLGEESQTEMFRIATINIIEVE